MTVQELLRRLPELSKADLEKVRHRVQVLAGSAGASPALKEDDWLLQGMGNELRRRGLIAGKIWAGLLPKNWDEKSSSVREFLLKGVGSKRLNHTEKLALAQMATSRLIAHFEPWADRITPNLIINNIQRVPQALEESFPGYWASRMLGVCLGSASWSQRS